VDKLYSNKDTNSLKGRPPGVYDVDGIIVHWDGQKVIKVGPDEMMEAH